MGEHMLTQLLTKHQIDAHLEKLDRQIKQLEADDISDIIDEPKRIQEPPRIYEKTSFGGSRIYQAGEFIVSAIAIILIIFAVMFTTLISTTLWEIITQFGFRQYASVTILAGILFGWGYFLGYARRE
jgi:hypothetical protein